MNKLIKEGKFNYIEIGDGKPIIILHGLMGGLSNFSGVSDYFPKIGYKVIIPRLPIYELSLDETNVENFSKYLHEFILFKKINKAFLLGNSLGGHIGLFYTKSYPEFVNGLIITGSSGLYENSMGGTYPKRGNYEYIKKKSEEVFYDPKIATKELVDEVFESVNDRNKLIRTLTIAKSAIRHNMSKDLPSMKTPVGIIWGVNDTVTPANVGEEFHKLLPNSDLYWIDKCGHAPMMEHPNKFNDILKNWLGKINI
jgi:pimeloyl-ACP methyl ester carboxylesterase